MSASERGDVWERTLAERDELRAEVERLREANRALRRALERIENHAHRDYRDYGTPGALWYSTIARATLDTSTGKES